MTTAVAAPCKYVRLARERQERDLEHGAERGLWFDEEAADYSVDFFARVLVHYKGEWAGQPFEPADWQADDILRPLFGWRRDDGTRRFRYAYVEVPTGGTKTSLAAGIGLLLMVGDDEAAAEVYSAATSRDQAKLVWRAAKQMVLESPDLKTIIEPCAHHLWAAGSGSVFRPISSEAKNQEGLDASGVIIDELHCWSGRDLWDVMVKRMRSRRQPLLFAISTAGIYSQGICWQEHQRAQAVLDGAYEDDSLFAYISHAEKEDDWTAEETWAKANPSLGVTPKLDFLRDECARAKRSPADVNAFLRYHLNIWTEQQDRWLSMEEWGACRRDIDWSKLAGQVCYGGMDLATTRDLAAFVLVFPLPDREYAVLPHFWIPEENMRERVEHDRVPYDQWRRAGHLTATPGNVIDYDFIIARVLEASKTYKIKEIGFDSWNATATASELQNKHGLVMVEMRQGHKTMSAPSNLFADLIHARKLHHDGHPVLAWNVMNVAVRADANLNIMPSKERSTERIDGVTAAVMALGRAMLGSGAVPRPMRISFA